MGQNEDCEILLIDDEATKTIVEHMEKNKISLLLGPRQRKGEI